MRSSNRKAFSLIELLVVIGILAVLVGILFPVVGRVRRAAYGASTAQSISTLQAAIQQYWSTFNGYPFARFGAVGATAYSGPSMTSSESLVVLLQGGIQFNPGTTYTFNAADVGRGPVSFNLRNPKRYTPFGGVKHSDGTMNALTETSLYSDTVVPEFIDSFPEPMPILYAPADTSIATKYAWSTFSAYGTPAPSASTTQFDQVTPNNTANAEREYFSDPSSKVTTPSVNFTRYRNADTYVLIAAGPDRKFGTKDDQTNFGTPGE